MSPDNAVSRTFQGSFRGERDGLARRRDVVGKRETEDRSLVKRRDVVRTVLQSGPLRLPAEKNLALETLCWFSNERDVCV